MKYFFGCTFMNQDELQSIGAEYPIKLEYYKTKSNNEKQSNEKDTKYGIEVVKTSYIKNNIDIERKILPEIVKDETVAEKILNVLKNNRVTPISAEYVIEDLLKAE